MNTKPFTSWLFSSQDKRIKLQIVIASTLIITTAWIAVTRQTAVAKRDKAYQTILAAQQVKNDEAVLKTSKEYFHNASLLGKDERIPQITVIYEESLVRWFAQQPKAEISAQNQEYLDLYKQLQKNTDVTQSQL